jgi:organic hydroperoxide reductase OsmC/OhrA
MTGKFPHAYGVSLDGDGAQAVLTAPDHPAIIGGAPPQFDGKGTWWSPEELLLGAVALCHMTTFRFYAKREGIVFREYRSQVEGTLDKTANGLAFTSIAIHIGLDVEAADVARVEEVVRTAKKYCIISNSLKVPVELDCVVRAAA